MSILEFGSPTPIGQTSTEEWGYDGDGNVRVCQVFEDVALAVWADWTGVHHFVARVVSWSADLVPTFGPEVGLLVPGQEAEAGGTSQDIIDLHQLDEGLAVVVASTRYYNGTTSENSPGVVLSVDPTTFNVTCLSRLPVDIGNDQNFNALVSCQGARRVTILADGNSRPSVLYTVTPSDGGFEVSSRTPGWSALTGSDGVVALLDIGDELLRLTGGGDGALEVWRHSYDFLGTATLISDAITEWGGLDTYAAKVGDWLHINTLMGYDQAEVGWNKNRLYSVSLVTGETRGPVLYERATNAFYDYYHHYSFAETVSEDYSLMGVSARPEPSEVDDDGPGNEWTGRIFASLFDGSAIVERAVAWDLDFRRGGWRETWARGLDCLVQRVPGESRLIVAATASVAIGVEPGFTEFEFEDQSFAILGRATLATPTAEFTHAVQDNGYVVEFDASLSSGGGGEIVAYAWDFKDPVTPGVVTVANAQTSYPYVVVPATYLVTLTVMNDAGQSASVTHEVNLTGGRIGSDYLGSNRHFTGAP